ncbi:glycosyltransferase family 2 protein [Nakamurella deserti]|uniref:glycosyltransferase family 2 protein n=1 Tax=Nakamurella deserti TaxID=2164074 RepID=UPI000DBE878E|nr:glycosyltransferase family 2 protein [Nakamurella deserti]
MPLQIVVPFYGDPGLLRRTVASVRAQTDPEWTLTVVDDGYPDPSVAAFFADLDDPRVRYLRNPVNLGANGNYRHCLALADQDWLVMLGADDELLPHYVATVRAAAAAHPTAAVIQPGVQVIDGDGAVVLPLLDRVKLRLLRPAGTTVLSGGALTASLLRGNWLYFPALAFRREPAQRIGFRTGLDVVQDLALVLDLIADGGSLVVLDTVCFSYRRHLASDSSGRALDGTRFDEQRRFFREAADRAEALGWRPAARAGRRHLLSRLHALTLLPVAVRARRWQGAATLARHVVGRPAA